MPPIPLEDPDPAGLLTGLAGLDEGGWVDLLGSEGDDLDRLCAAADRVRAAQVGDDVTFVVNRNLDPGVVAAVDADPARLELLVREAWELGATEICLQGLLPEPSCFASYVDLVAAVRRAAPEIHVHAFRPPEVADGARRSGLSVPDFLAAARRAGLGSVPGTAAQVLDDAVRSELAGDGVVPMPVAEWVQLITAAHDAGLRSTATLLFGHVETPVQVVRHLRLLGEIQARTGGFTELIAMPMLHHQAPPHLRDVVPLTPDRRTVRATYAVARLMLGHLVPHVQAAWPRIGLDLTRDVLRGGADDLGGLLLDGDLAPAAGQEAGLSLTREDVSALTAELGRGLRQRRTDYSSLEAGLDG